MAGMAAPHTPSRDPRSTHIDPTGVRAVYNQVADTYADHFPATEPESALELGMIDLFCSLIGGERRVLDAGCGAGRLLPYLAERGCTVEGVDLSPGMIARARRDHPEFPVEVASLSDLSHPGDTFDGVFSWYSTIHTDDAALPGLVSEMRRVLRPGGLMLLAFQTGSGVRDIAEGFRKRGHAVELLRAHRTPAEVGALLAAQGMTSVARFDRLPLGSERDGQAVLIVREETDTYGPDALSPPAP